MSAAALPAQADQLRGLHVPGSPLLSVEIRHMGGALGRVPAGAGALGRIAGRFMLYAVGIAMPPGAAPAVAEEVARVNAVMSEWGAGRSFLNFADAPADTRTMFEPDDHRRLGEIRARLDPEALLQANHPISAGE